MFGFLELGGRFPLLDTMATTAPENFQIKKKNYAILSHKQVIIPHTVNNLFTKCLQNINNLQSVKNSALVYVGERNKSGFFSL